MMTEAELRERLRMLAPQSDTVAVMDEFRRLHSLEEQYAAVTEERRLAGTRIRELQEQFETIEERLDIALGALHDITGMNHNDQRGTVFQFEQRVHKVAHDAWMAARGKATNPAERSE